MRGPKATASDVARPSNESEYLKAIALFRNAEPDRALSAIVLDRSPKARVLAARVLLRLGQYDALLSELRSIPAQGLPALLRGEIQMLEAVALLRTQGGTRRELVHPAQLMLEDARNIGLMAGHFELQLECQIYLSDPPRQSGDHATALDILERSLNFARYSNLPHDPNWIVPGDRVVTRNLEYLGQAHAALGHYDEFLRCYSEALIVHDGSTKDVTHEAFLVSAMASFARDGEVSNDLPDSLLKRAYALPETPYIIAHRFATYRSIAINKAVNGDYFGALQCLREAKKLALDLPYNVVCAADHAFVAFLFGHDHAGEEQLNSGIDTALQTNWEESRHESHYGLVILAHVAAARSTRSARKLIEIFRGVRRDIPLMSGSNWDRRIRMIFLMSEGCVMKAEGRIAEAKELLSEVFAFYQASGAFRRLAADAALELAELTNDPRLFGYAAKWINAHPLPYTVKRLAALRELLPR